MRCFEVLLHVELVCSQPVLAPLVFKISWEAIETWKLSIPKAQQVVEELLKQTGLQMNFDELWEPQELVV